MQTDENKLVHNELADEFMETMIHGMVVSNIAHLVGKELNLSTEELRKVCLAGMVHDIGKLKINSYRKYQHRSMQIDEMRYMRTHPTLGYAVLTEKEFEPEICQAVLYHHENYDGSGYPANLCGDEIPFIARVIHVCDVFSALISSRIYRKAFDIDTAIEIMIDEVRHFDMRIFLAFQRIAQSREMIFALGNLSSFTREQFHYEYDKGNEDN